MFRKTYKLDEIQQIEIGRQTDNALPEIRINLMPYFAEIGAKNYDLLLKRKGDTTYYPVDTRLEGVVLVWTIKAADVNVPGIGTARIVATDDDDGVWNSKDIEIVVGATDGNTSDAPDAPSKAWVNNVLAYKTAAAASATSAASSANNASASASSASGSASSASASAQRAASTLQTFEAKLAAGDYKGEPGAPGAPGTPGSDANVTADNIKAALGIDVVQAIDNVENQIDYLDENKSDVGHTHDYTELTNQPVIPEAYNDAEIRGQVSQLNTDLSTKLTEPNTGLAVGKYFRIASIDSDGHAVLEAVDITHTDVQINGTSIVQDGSANIPLASANVYGLIRGDGVGVSVNPQGKPYVAAANESAINLRTSQYNPIVPSKLDYAVKSAMCDGVGAAWTADEQAAACARVGAERKLANGWVLVATMTSADAINVDLSAYSELIIHAYVAGTGNSTLRSDAGTLIDVICSNGKRTTYARYDDGPLGYECIHAEYAGGSSKQSFATGLSNGYTRMDGYYIKNIHSFYFGTPANITSCDINIYAR